MSAPLTSEKPALMERVIAVLLGVDIDGWLRLIGLGLIGHGILLLWAIVRLGSATTAKINLAAIAPYPVLMIVLSATGLIDRSLGQVLALVDGAIIAGIAVWLWVGFRDARPTRQYRHA